jgi:DNA invertase Pin-like site-specific DNA recombinase
MDRFAREIDVQNTLLKMLTRNNLSLYSANTGENITEAMLSDPTRKLMVGFQGLISEWEKDMLVMRMGKGRKSKKARTGRCEGGHPYGSHPDLPEEQETLQKMLDLAKSHNYQEVADILNLTGCRTRKGGEWQKATVFKIVQRQAKRAAANQMARKPCVN